MELSPEHLIAHSVMSYIDEGLLTSTIDRRIASIGGGLLDLDAGERSIALAVLTSVAHRHLLAKLARPDLPENNRVSIEAQAIEVAALFIAQIAELVHPRSRRSL